MPNQKMPKVGDRLMKVMHSSHIWNEDEPLPCVVTYVNKPKNYYQVTFDDFGVKECYKLVEFDEIEDFKYRYKSMFGKNPEGVYVFESGVLYPSIRECAKDIGVMPSAVIKHLHGLTSHVKGYHIYIL